MSDKLKQRLDNGLAAMGMDLPDAQRQRLIAYVELLAKWNRAYNLTAIRDLDDSIGRHLLDSLAIRPWLEGGESVLDLGSGGGLPGIPLAITEPDRRFTLLDGNGKKTRFLVQVAAELELPNVSVVNSRAEAYHPPSLFDVITSRAVGQLPDMLAASCHLLRPGGLFLAMKGTYPAAELDALPAGWSLEAITALAVPGVEGERHLVQVRQVGC